MILVPDDAFYRTFCKAVDPANICILACLGTCSLQQQHCEAGYSGAVMSHNNWPPLQRMQQSRKGTYGRTICPLISWISLILL